MEERTEEHILSKTRCLREPRNSATRHTYTRSVGIEIPLHIGFQRTSSSIN
jgi:hypothetical protein